MANYIFASNSTTVHYSNSGRTRNSVAFAAPVLVVLVVMMVTLVLLTVLGNALVIFAFKMDKSLRRQSNYFLLNLAISDFLVGALCIPVYIPYILTGKWMLGKGICKMWLVMDYMLCTASVFNIVLISYDRFLSVTRAVSYRARQGMTNHAVGKMAAVWVLAFLLYGPAILFWEYVSGESHVPEHECFAEFYYSWYFLLCASTLEFFSPFISVAFFNLSIYLSIRRRRLRSRLDTGSPKPKAIAPAQGERSHLNFLLCRNSVMPRKRMACENGEKDVRSCSSQMSPCSARRNNSMSVRSTQYSRLSQDKKLAKSLAVIVCVFAVCWAPYTLLMIIRAACRGNCVEHHWYEVTFWLLWLNSAINPLLYPLCHRSFRRAFAKILCPRHRSTQPPPDPPSPN
ncbi:histamine H3 receptor [Chanos chanos]|uniref:Histamine H3 receptor n=1 Tax=Chanos chanos TaxID=29144 RepID=A0A6J2VFV0_CHACN|nr:histamine H3 receptor-like [Chanos chanos]